MANPPRPSAVKVGYLDLKIKWLDGKAWDRLGEEHAGTGGLTYWGTGEILIRTQFDGSLNVHEVVLKEVLLHEILHACYQAGGMANSHVPEEPQALEEQIVAMLSVPLLQVLRDNAPVARYLTA